MIPLLLAIAVGRETVPFCVPARVTSDLLAVPWKPPRRQAKIRRPVQNRRVSMSCWLVSGSTNWSDAAEHFQGNEPTVRYSPVEANEARIRIAHIHAHMLAGAAK